MSRRAWIAASAIAATLGISALAIGAATRETALLAAALGLGCGAVHAGSRGRLERWPALLVLLALALAMTALQLIPLPLSVINALGTKGALVGGNAAALGEPAPWLTAISHDPAATWLELAKLVGYLGFAVCCTRLATAERGRRLIAASIAGTAAAVAAVALLHEVAGATALYGIYRPRYAGDPVLLAPFLSPNHLAALMVLAAPIAAGLALEARERARLPWLGALGLVIAVALLSRSRGGAVALLVALVAVAALALPLWQQGARRRRRLQRSNRVAIALIAATGIAVGLATAGRGALDEIARTDVDELTGERGKIEVWGQAVELARANPWVGIGRGAFEFAAPSSEQNVTASHVENEYLQAALDWGVPFALLALLALVAAGRRAAARARGSLIEAGLAAGLIGLALHQLADFALELPGVAYPALAAFAALARVDVVAGGPSWWRRGRVAALVAGAALIAAAASPLATPVRDETDALAARFDSRAASGALGPALATWRRHPGDFIAAAQAAEALFARGDRRAVAVINRALALNPAHPDLHRIAARMLRASQRPDQALVEYRRAIARASDRAALIRELRAAFPDARTAAGGLPIDRRFAAATLPAIAALGDHELGFRYTSALVERHPRDARFHRARAHHAFETHRYDAAVESGRIAVDGRQPAADLVLARALIARGDHGEAEAVLAASDQRRAVRPKRQILAELRLLARAQRAQSRHAAAIATLERALEIAGADRRAANPLHGDLAISQEAMGLDNAAAASRARAGGLE